MIPKEVFCCKVFHKNNIAFSQAGLIWEQRSDKELDETAAPTLNSEMLEFPHVWLVAGATIAFIILTIETLFSRGSKAIFSCEATLYPTSLYSENTKASFHTFQQIVTKS